MTTEYEVTVACLVHVPFHTPDGLRLGTLYQGDRLPDQVPADKLDYWLAGGMIREVGAAEPEAEAANASELKVDGRSSKAALVDYGVAQGDDKEELSQLSRDQLLDRYVRKGTTE